MVASDRAGGSWSGCVRNSPAAGSIRRQPPAAAVPVSCVDSSLLPWMWRHPGIACVAAWPDCIGLEHEPAGCAGDPVDSADALERSAFTPDMDGQSFGCAPVAATRGGFHDLAQPAMGAVCLAGARVVLDNSKRESCRRVISRESSVNWRAGEISSPIHSGRLWPRCVSAALFLVGNPDRPCCPADGPG